MNGLTKHCNVQLFQAKLVTSVMFQDFYVQADPILGTNLFHERDFFGRQLVTGVGQLQATVS